MASALIFHAMQRVKNIVAALPQAEIIDVEALRNAILEGTIDLICVLGPTASGKTKYAVKLARELALWEPGTSERTLTPEEGGDPLAGRVLSGVTDSQRAIRCEIISADSRQVYRGMDIGTGKDLCEYGEIPYHLIDIAEPGTQYNVYRFQQDFARAMEDIRSRGAFPILCGGTGLYISAVTCSYDFLTKKPLSAPVTMYPGAADLSLYEPEAEQASLPPAPRTYFIGTLVSREVRNQRIDARLDARLEEGMIDEIRGLLKRGVPAQTLISYGLEYKFVTLYLLGQIDYPTMRERLAIAIHQFAKRQMTWFRGMERSGICIHWTEV